MHRALRSVGSFLLASAPLAYLACGGDAASPAVAGAADASPASTAAPRVDGVGTTASDGDAATASAPATVTVTAVRRSTATPEAAASVVFYDGTGAVTATATTDAKGQATGPTGTGGKVTVVFGSAGTPRLVTYLGVSPGDALTALDDDGAGAPFTLQVTPPATPVDGAVSLAVVAGACGAVLPGGTAGGTTDAADGLDRSCFYPGASSTLYLVALDAAGTRLASTSLADVALKDDGTPTPAVFTNPWTAFGTGKTVVATNVPTTLAAGVARTRVGLTHQMGAGNGTSHAIARRNIAADQPTYSFFFDPSSVPGPTFQQNEAAVLEQLLAAPHGLLTRAIAVRGAITETTTIDLAETLPRITAATVTGTTVPTVSFTSEAPLTGTKGLLASVRWSAPSGTYGTWVVVAPSSATSVTPPELPATLAAYAPSASTTWLSSPMIAAFDGSGIADYAAFRTSATLVTPTLSLRNGYPYRIVPLLPVDGTVKVTAYTLNPG